jgi:5-methylcytosine-specific restriction protein A
MQERFEIRRMGLEPYLDLALAKNNQFHFSVNGSTEGITLDEEWQEIDFVLSKSYFSEESEFSSLSAVILDFMCIVLFLIIEDTEWTENDEEWREEGLESFELVRKYERSRYNRALCLKYYGFVCRGCGDKLEEKYGPVGANVIHVHHIVPVSLMNGSYQLNPVTDLIPLCPNCHNIVHRTNPPMLIEELNSLTRFKIDS